MSKGYDYLLGMKLWSLTLEKVRQLENELEEKTKAMGLLKVGYLFWWFISFWSRNKLLLRSPYDGWKPDVGTESRISDASRD